MLHKEPESVGSTFLKHFIGPLLLAMVAGVSSYIGVQQKVNDVSAVVSSVATDVKALKDNQDKIWKDYYLPRKDEWFMHSESLARLRSQVDDLNRNFIDLRDDVRYSRSKGK